MILYNERNEIKIKFTDDFDEELHKSPLQKHISTLL